MSDEDEIWADENQPAEANELYDPELRDAQDQSVSYGAQVIEASNER
jgi:hypothetical protein